MSNVLILKSSINGPASLTNQLIDEYMQTRREAGHQDSVVEHDLTTLALPKLDGALFAALRGAPMYNLNVPTDLKNWFDLVARARETFRYTETWPQGLVEGVRAVVISSRGGVHDGQPSDAVTPYLRAVLGLMGISDVEFIYAEGMDIRPHGRDAGIAHARQHIARAAQQA